ncbi:MAG: hypothetical protein MMC33_006212 [Icmadophila ericetorum]|nr:hypothetical protein [Icmadophila ericetorum]
MGLGRSWLMKAAYPMRSTTFMSVLQAGILDLDSKGRRFSQLFVVIDALDELADESQHGLSEGLRAIEPPIHLMATYHPTGICTEEFEGTISTKIAAEPTDLIS